MVRAVSTCAGIMGMVTVHHTGRNHHGAHGGYAAPRGGTAKCAPKLGVWNLHAGTLSHAFVQIRAPVLPRSLARPAAWLALTTGLPFSALLVWAFCAWGRDDWQALVAWALFQGVGGLLLGVGILAPQLRRWPAMVRLACAAVLVSWSLALIVTLEFSDQLGKSRCLGGFLILLFLAGGVALKSRVAIRVMTAVATWQVVFHTGATYASFLCVHEELNTTWDALLALLFLLMTVLGSELEPPPPLGSRRGMLTHAAGLGIALLAATPHILPQDLESATLHPAACGAGALVLLAWILAGIQQASTRTGEPTIALPKLAWPLALARLIARLLLVVLAGGTILTGAWSAYSGLFSSPGQGVLMVVPVAGFVAAPMLLVWLLASFARLFIVSARQRLVADDAGFRFIERSAGRYVPFAECRWTELHPTLWGAELVLRDSDFRALGTHLLLDSASVATAARALRRCETVRARVLLHGTEPVGLLLRSQGAPFGPWMRSIQDAVRRGAVYRERALGAELLWAILDDRCQPPDQRAGAAVALIALHETGRVLTRLESGGMPPLVIVAAELAGAEVDSGVLGEAMSSFSREEQSEFRALQKGRCCPGHAG